MKNLSRLSFIGLACLLISAISHAQIIRTPVALSANSGTTGSLPGSNGDPAPDSRGWTDPALDHNRLLVGNGTYQLIGAYKVKGSQYLYGQKLSGDIFSSSEKGFNIFISYDTYKQNVEFYSTSNPDNALVKEPESIDSFIIHANESIGITSPLKFVYGTVLGSKEKSYYQQVYAGSRFTVYKKYKSEIGIDPGNYAQGDLRQFDLEFEYYYYDADTKALKRIKPNSSNITKEFKSVKNLSGVVTDDDFTANSDAAMVKVFEALNQPKAF